MIWFAEVTNEKKSFQQLWSIKILMVLKAKNTCLSVSGVPGDSWLLIHEDLIRSIRYR